MSPRGLWGKRGRLRVIAVCALMAGAGLLGLLALREALGGGGAPSAVLGEKILESAGLDELLDELDGEVAADVDAVLVSTPRAPSSSTGYASERPAAQEAGAVLAAYEERADCVVAQSGWLDLLGKTWGCVIQGEGWVDLCVVQEEEDGGSDVSVMRMDASGL